MLIVQLVVLLPLLVVCSLVPGFVFIRRLRWTPLEKALWLNRSVLRAPVPRRLGIFCFGPKDQRTAFDVIELIVLFAGLRVRHDLPRSLRTFRCRQAIVGYGFLFLLRILGRESLLCSNSPPKTCSLATSGSRRALHNASCSPASPEFPQTHVSFTVPA
jgi:hypothetical protein